MTKRDCEEFFNVIAGLNSAAYVSDTSLAFAQTVAVSAARLLREERERREPQSVGIDPEHAQHLLQRHLQTHLEAHLDQTQ